MLAKIHAKRIVARHIGWRLPKKQSHALVLAIARAMRNYAKYAVKMERKTVELRKKFGVDA